MSEASITFRRASLEDVPAIDQLIRLSARSLGTTDYTPEQIELALEGAFGVDTTLIRDGTFFVAEDGMLVGCGWWSFRSALFGADSVSGQFPERLDPERDAARLRAFFIHPNYARRGIGRMLVEMCEQEARAMGFRAVQLLANLGGVRLYQALGYNAGEPVEHELRGGVRIQFVPMYRAL
jgi:N-acetylglutamate synthase-like GNAT family acetyltransferase